MGFDEYEVRRTSVKVFLAGLILAVLLSIILHSISYCLGFVLGYLIDLLILQINMKMTDTILSIQTAGKTIVVMLFMAKLFIFAVGFAIAGFFPEIVNMYTVFLGYLVVKISIYIHAYGERRRMR
ncbi:hypothetical protein [Catenibacterium sp.]|uniref:hypothetical protein n=1 Tax=Catenibacterium sp. TaxID=2049022 RepID=UPI003AAB5503